MGNCQKDHSAIQDIMKELPIHQGGFGRHKCAACAYELGYNDGKNQVKNIDIYKKINDLEDSQAGNQRHKSAHVAYIKGYYDGIMQSYSQCPIEEIDFTESSNSEKSLDFLNILIQDLINSKYPAYSDFHMCGLRQCTFEKALKSNSIITIDDFVNYSGDFGNIRGIGNKAIDEINKFGQFVKRHLGPNLSVNHIGTVDFSSEFSHAKMTLLECYYLALQDGLDARSIKLLAQYSPSEFYSKFQTYTIDQFSNIAGIGKKSAHELYEFKRVLKKFITDIKEKSDNLCQWETFKYTVGEVLHDDSTIKDFFLREQKLPALRVLELLFVSFVDSIELYTLFEKYNVSVCLSRIERPNRVNEWFRTTTQKVQENITNKESIVVGNDEYRAFMKAYRGLVVEDNFKYLLDSLQSNDIINTSIIEQYCQDEDCHLPASLIIDILGGIWTDNYTRMEFENQVILVNKDLTDHFDFLKATSSILEKVCEDYAVDEIISLEDFVNTDVESWIIYDFQYNDRIKNTLIEILLLNNLICTLLNGEELIIPASSEKASVEIVLQSMRVLSTPVTVEEVFNYLVVNNPDAEISLDKITYILNHNECIVNTRFESRFALKENNPVIGSIRDFVKQILERSDIPLSSKDIYNRLPVERQRDERSLSSNLGQADCTCKFIGELWGLKDKKYPDEYRIDITQFSISDRITKIFNFVQENKRLPVEADGPDFRQLRTWWNSYRNSPNLTDNDRKLIQEIYAILENSNFDYFKEFVKLNQRYPKTKSPDQTEKKLALWFDNLLLAFKNDELDEDVIEQCRDLVIYAQRYIN